MKYFLIMCSMLLVTSAYSAKVKVDSDELIQIQTIAVLADGTPVSINGTITGVETAPKGDYRIRITNGKSYNSKYFSKMKCTILPLNDIKYTENSIPLATHFVVKGELYMSTGFYFGMGDKSPINGYQVTIKNGKNKGDWNSMNCKISD